MTNDHHAYFLAEGHCILETPAERCPSAAGVQECITVAIWSYQHARQTPAADGWPTDSARSIGAPRHGGAA